MTKEDENLLLIDLSARLRYGVKLETECGIEVLDTLIVSNGWVNDSYDIDDVKPFLRSMSSMTEEESRQYRDFVEYSYNDFTSESIPCVYLNRINEFINWLNSHYFDYRGLIEKGLAIEAPEGMYKIVPISI